MFARHTMPKYVAASKLKCLKSSKIRSDTPAYSGLLPYPATVAPAQQPARAHCQRTTTYCCRYNRSPGWIRIPGAALVSCEEPEPPCGADLDSTGAAPTLDSHPDPDPDPDPDPHPDRDPFAGPWHPTVPALAASPWPGFPAPAAGEHGALGVVFPSLRSSLPRLVRNDSKKVRNETFMLRVACSNDHLASAASVTPAVREQPARARRTRQD